MTVQVSGRVWDWAGLWMTYQNGCFPSLSCLPWVSPTPHSFQVTNKSRRRVRPRREANIVSIFYLFPTVKSDLLVNIKGHAALVQAGCQTDHRWSYLLQLFLDSSPALLFSSSKHSVEIPLHQQNKELAFPRLLTPNVSLCLAPPVLLVQYGLQSMSNSNKNHPHSSTETEKYQQASSQAM